MGCSELRGVGDMDKVLCDNAFSEKSVEKLQIKRQECLC